MRVYQFSLNIGVTTALISCQAAGLHPKILVLHYRLCLTVIDRSEAHSAVSPCRTDQKSRPLLLSRLFFFDQSKSFDLLSHKCIFVSSTITLLNKRSATRFGTAISAFVMSENVQTIWSDKTDPINTETTQAQR